MNQKLIERSSTAKAPVKQPDWYRALSKYETPDLRKAAWQMLNTFVPYLALWALMVYMVRTGVSYWLMLPLIVVAAGLLIRIFIFFHDCCHGCFFASRKANRLLGYITGTLTFTPFEYWRHLHAGHHATAGDLDRRGIGDIWTLTVEEYLAASWRTKLAYRLYRNPFILFVLGPSFVFMIGQRLPYKGIRKRERNSMLLTNLALLGILAAAYWTIGLRTYFLIQIPVMALAGTVGVWLFYVQHQFESVYWTRHEDWDPMRAALEGSSYYRLPKILQWFSGNIGLHHLHHLRPRVPNYNLQRCFNDIPVLQTVERLTIRRSLKSLFLNLWDEADQKLISFRSLSARRRMAADCQSP